MTNSSGDSPQVPFELVAALYLLAIAVGFGAISVALAPTTILMVALTIAILTHLINVHTLSSKKAYGLLPFGIDFALIALFAWMFNLLAHPLAIGTTELIPPVVGSSDFLAALVPSTIPAEQAQGPVQSAFFQFFVIGCAALVLIVAWHMLAWKKPPRGLKVELMKPGWHFGGWGLLAVVLAAGIYFAKKGQSDWEAMYTGVYVLSGIALLITVAFLGIVLKEGSTYRITTEATTPPAE